VRKASLTDVALTLDIFTFTGKESEVQAMENGGNVLVNAVYEGRLPRNNEKPTYQTNGVARERFVRDKYELRKFYEASAFATFQQMIELNSKAKEQRQRQNHKTRPHAKPESSPIDSFATNVDMDWASDIFSSQNATAVDPFKAKISSADESLFSDASDFSDFESDNSHRRRRRKQSVAHGAKLSEKDTAIFKPFGSEEVNNMFSKVEDYFSEYDTEPSERGQKSKSRSKQLSSSAQKKSSHAPSFRLDYNNTNKWGQSDDFDDDFGGSGFDTDDDDDDGDCGLKNHQRIKSAAEAEAKLSDQEKKRVKAERRQKRREARVRAWLGPGSESSDSDSPPSHRSRPLNRSQSERPRGRNVNVSSGAAPPHKKQASRRTFKRQESSKSLSSNGSKDNVSTVPDRQKEQSGKNQTSTSPKSVIEETDNNLAQQSLDGDESERKCRSVNRSRRSKDYQEASRGERDRSQSRTRKPSLRSESRNRDRDRSRSQSRHRSSSEDLDASMLAGRKGSLLAGSGNTVESDHEEEEKDLFHDNTLPMNRHQGNNGTKDDSEVEISQKKKGNNHSESHPSSKNKKDKPSREDENEDSDSDEGKEMFRKKKKKDKKWAPSSNQKRQPPHSPEKMNALSRRNATVFPSTNVRLDTADKNERPERLNSSGPSSSSATNREPESEMTESRGSFDPFSDTHSLAFGNPDTAAAFGGQTQRVRRATLSFGQTSGDEVVSGSTKATAAALRRGSALQGAYQAPPATSNRKLGDPSGRRFGEDTTKSKTNALGAPKHDKAVDDVLQNRKLRHVGSTRVRASPPPEHIESSFKSAFAKFQNG